MSRHIEDSGMDGLNPTTEEYDGRFSISLAYKSKTEKNLAGFFGRTTRYCLTICRRPSRRSIQREKARRRKISEFSGATVGDMLYGYPYSMSLIRLTRVAHSW